MLTLFIEALLFLSAAIVAAPLAQRFGLGSVLGYLIAGMILSPILAFAGINAEEVQHVAEFGVVLMLFLIGLELQPSKLWDMRSDLVGLGGLQIGVSAFAIAGAASLMGLNWQQSVAIGLMLALSSTAIVLQTLNERHLTATRGGQASFSILLVQDVAVLPILAILPLLASGLGPEVPAAGADSHGGGFVAHLPVWGQALAIAGAITLVILGGKFGVRPALRLIASVHLRESLTAAALFLVIGIAALMTVVGLSPALGAFLAGVVLSDSEFRHELEANLEPFKGLLMGAFFVTVGAGIDFALLGSEAGLIGALVIGLLLLKGAILFGVGTVLGIRGEARWLMALGLAQAGEFGFVLVGFSKPLGVLDPFVGDVLTAVIAITMVLTPVLFILYVKVFTDKRPPVQEQAAADTPPEGRVIVAGLGRFGQIVERLLRAAGHESVAIDADPDQIKVMQKFGYQGYYGDVSRPDLLHAAGVEKATAFVIAVNERGRAVDLAHYVSSVNPNCTIVARAHDRQHTYQLRDAGAQIVVREMFGSSLEAGEAVLRALGSTPEAAKRKRDLFETHDRRTLDELYRHWNDDNSVLDNQGYMNRARAMREELTRLLTDDRQSDELIEPAPDDGEK